MESGEILDLDVTGVAHGGVFVARHHEAEGERPLVVFVPDAIPGERVRVRVTQVKKSFARAEALEILEASPHRAPHVWRQAGLDEDRAGRPGGADFGHIALAHQRKLKAEVLRDAFARFADLPVDVEVESAGDDETPSGTRWRTRVGLHVDASGRVGPYAARSHEVVEVAEHPLATAAIERVALQLRDEREGRIDLVQPADGEVRVLRRPDGRGSRRARPEIVTERVGERTFRVDAGGFWQVHRLAATALDAAVRDALAGLDAQPGAHHLDLYGGVGLFAAALAEHGGGSRVTTVESAPRATEHAARNLEGLGASAVTARVERFLAGLDADPALSRGVTLLDPPRAGAGAEVVSRIAGQDPHAVVYVACDPVALARDVGSFREHGFVVERLRAFDLFPNSHHVEAVAVLRRA